MHETGIRDYISISVIRIPKRSELPTVVDENVLTSHEVGIAFNGGKTVQIRKHRLHERLLLLQCPSSTELTMPSAFENYKH